MKTLSSYQDKTNRWSSHSYIAGILITLPKGSRILDVGSATGTLARMCTERGLIFRGIEPNPISRDTAQDFYTEIYPGSLEEAPDSFLGNNDAVVCADVLEHLLNPTQQLTRLVCLQASGCLFIISVPNIANIWVRMNLLIGRFNYSERGILDRTHLHFFTKKTFTELLRDAELIIVEEYATPIPLDLVSPFFSTNLMGKIMFKFLAYITTWWPTLFGYQWVTKATKIGS